MPRSDWLPRSDEDRVTWLNNFATKLPTHATALALAPPDTSAVTADAAYWQ